MAEDNLYQIVIDSLPASARHRRTWMSLVRCFSSIEAVLMRYFAQQYNSSLPRYDVLTALAMHPEGLTMGDLSDMLMVTKGNVTGVIRRLVHDNLVKKKTDKADRRVQLVKISKRGMALWEEMHADYDNIISTLMGGVSQADSKTIIKALDKVRANVEANAASLESDG
jgi:DNA-binding MarR family transcriptional regulator